jgi:replicative DNA helicase
MSEDKPDYKRPDKSIYNLDFLAKLPPQALRLEETVLGILLLEKDSIVRITDIIQPDMFYRDEHKIIYQTILDLFKHSKPTDILTVCEDLRKQGKLDQIGGEYYISELTNRIGSSTTLENHCKKIAEKYLLREFIRFSSVLNEQAYDESTDVFELMEKTTTDLYNIINCIKEGDTKTAKEIIFKIYEQINNPDKILTLQSRLNWINEIIGGYSPGNVIIVASRPGHGKSVFGINEASYISELAPCLYISLEMTQEELIKRHLSALSKIHNFRVQRNNIYSDEVEKFDKAAGKAETLNLLINDRSGQSVDNIYLLAKKYKLQVGIRALFIDHFHLIKKTKKSDSESYKYNSTRLKEIAKDLNIPVIALFQLNREMEKEPKRRPRNTDLREVGEEDADVIMFLRRLELFGIQEYEGLPTENKIFIDITKNRQYKTGGKVMNFSGDFQEIIEQEQTVENIPY